MFVLVRMVIFSFMAYVFSTMSVHAYQSSDYEEVSKALKNYSDLIDIAVSDEPVYDYELRKGRNNLLSILHDERDKDRVVDIVDRLLESTHEYSDVEKLGKPILFTIKYGCDFLSSLGTEYALDRLIDEYEFWDNTTIKDSIHYIITLASRSNSDTFDDYRFSKLKCEAAEEVEAYYDCLNAVEVLNNLDEPAIGTVLNGGGKICCD